MKPLRTWLSQKILNPLLLQLRQGADPRRLAWSVSLGGALGIFPIMGSTTLLCGAAGAMLRLNHVAMQTANYVVYAPQLALIPAFIRLGEKISGAEPIAVDLAAMRARFAESPSRFFQDFGIAAWHGVLAWAVVIPIPTCLLALFLNRVFTKLLNSKGA